MKNSLGRPRNPDVEKAVYKATIDLLAAEGYGRISISDVAARAGTTRPTIYLRWESIHDLVIDALDWYTSELPAPVSEGDELVEALENAANMFIPEGQLGLGLGIIGHVIADARQHPEFMSIVKERMIDPYRVVIVNVLKRYMKNGIIRGDLAPEIIADLMMGSFFTIFMNTGDVTVGSAERIVASMWPLLSEQELPRRQAIEGFVSRRIR